MCCLSSESIDFFLTGSWVTLILWCLFLRFVMAAYSLNLIHPYYWSVILLVSLPNALGIKWTLTFLAGQPCVSSRNCSAYRRLVPVLCLKVVLLVGVLVSWNFSLHVHNSSSVQDLRGPNCKFLEPFLYMDHFSLVLCSHRFYPSHTPWISLSPELKKTTVFCLCFCFLKCILQHAVRKKNKVKIGLSSLYFSCLKDHILLFPVVRGSHLFYRYLLAYTGHLGSVFACYPRFVITE